MLADVNDTFSGNAAGVGISLEKWGLDPFLVRRQWPKRLPSQETAGLMAISIQNAEYGYIMAWIQRFNQEQERGRPN